MNQLAGGKPGPDCCCHCCQHACAAVHLPGASACLQSHVGCRNDRHCCHPAAAPATPYHSCQQPEQPTQARADTRTSRPGRPCTAAADCCPASVITTAHQPVSWLADRSRYPSRCSRAHTAGAAAPSPAPAAGAAAAAPAAGASPAGAATCCCSSLRPPALPAAGAVLPSRRPLRRLPPRSRKRSGQVPLMRLRGSWPPSWLPLSSKKRSSQPRGRAGRLPPNELSAASKKRRDAGSWEGRGPPSELPLTSKTCRLGGRPAAHAAAAAAAATAEHQGHARSLQQRMLSARADTHTCCTQVSVIHSPVCRRTRVWQAAGESVALHVKLRRLAQVGQRWQLAGQGVERHIKRDQPWRQRACRQQQQQHASVLAVRLCRCQQQRCQPSAQISRTAAAHSTCTARVAHPGGRRARWRSG